MFASLESLPLEEMNLRHDKVRTRLQKHAPEAQGLLVFSKVNLYYLTGSLANGLLWLPLEGEPVALLRRGLERMRLESPLTTVLPFRSYAQVPNLLAEAGSPLGKTVAAEMSGLSWSLGQMLEQRISGVSFVPGDQAIMQARSVKTPWEIAKLTLAGERHHHSLHDLLPKLIRPGMTERKISHLAWEVFFSQGHMGIMRMNAFGEEIFLGHVSAGDSANYPSSFNGPVGLRGEHPAIPFMGYAGKVWREHEPLVCDIGFSLEGYATDKTQVYWSGPRSSIPREVLDGHEFCLDIQAYIAENLRPGAIPSRIYEECMAMARKSPFEDGFMALDGNKVSFLGHGIGLSIDEQPVIAKGFDEPLEENTVLALEPKMGLRGLGMVGAENTFLVTPQGGRCLTGQTYEIVCVE